MCVSVVGYVAELVDFALARIKHIKIPFMGNIKVNSDSSSQDQATALDPKGARTLHTDKLFVQCIKTSCHLGLLGIFF